MDELLAAVGAVGAVGAAAAACRAASAAASDSPSGSSGGAGNGVLALARWAGAHPLRLCGVACAAVAANAAARRAAAAWRRRQGGRGEGGKQRRCGRCGRLFEGNASPAGALAGLGWSNGVALSEGDGDAVAAAAVAASAAEVAEAAAAGLPLTAEGAAAAAAAAAAAGDPTADASRQYTHAIVVLGFLRETDPPYRMDLSKDEKAAQNYAFVGPTEFLRLRVERAAHQYHALRRNGQHVVVVATGGDPQRLGSTEAELMREMLAGMGVPEADVVEEDKARHTIENGVFVCKYTVEATMPAVTDLYIVTNEFHGERAFQIFERFAPPGTTLHRCFAPDGDPNLLEAQTGRRFKASADGDVDDPRTTDPPTWTSEEHRQLASKAFGAVLHTNIRAYSQLIVAVSNGNLWAVQHAPKFLDGLRQRGGSGPFHYACLHATGAEIVAELLKHEELVPLASERNDNGCTPLHFLPYAPCFEGGRGSAALAVRAMLLAAGCPERVRGRSAMWEGARTAEELWVACETAAEASANGGGGGGKGSSSSGSGISSVGSSGSGGGSGGGGGDDDGGSNGGNGSSGGSSRGTASSVAPTLLRAPSPMGSRIARRDSYVAFSSDLDYVPLRETARVGSLAGVQRWIEEHPGRSVDPEPHDRHSSALHYACGPLSGVGDGVGVVVALLAAGADVDRLNRDKASPLHFAVWHQHREIVRVLLRHGCKTLAQRGDNWWWDVPQTPIELAFRRAAEAEPQTRDAEVARDILSLLTTAQYKWRMTQKTLRMLTPITPSPNRLQSAPDFGTDPRRRASLPPIGSALRRVAVARRTPASAGGGGGRGRGNQGGNRRDAGGDADC